MTAVPRRAVLAAVLTIGLGGGTAAVVRTRSPSTGESSPAGGAAIGSTAYGPANALPFREDFTRDAAEGHFRAVHGERFDVYPTGWRDTSKVGVYRPDDVLSVHDGVLDFRLHTVDGQPATAAVVPRITGYGQTYGRYSLRLRADAVHGFKLAFLLWPDSERWPDDGEIDFPDADLTGSLGAFLHHADPAGSQEEFSSDATFEEWHTTTIEWSPGLVRFLLDDVVVGSSTTGVPDTSMHFVLQTETSLAAADDPAAGPAAGAQGHVLVDWLTIESHPWS
ncbi:glycoside hydrolase family 16 protein [Kineococcus rubinsiae]|uniref:glycoside hydrolase family 16 protein n=1 Tax=Kineococcus rubinsiae TaxID=2609562 RepID=UPI0014320C9F|nr:glycoside hydrolase family 16 protein [Kineococcus rubinsiae]